MSLKTSQRIKLTEADIEDMAETLLLYDNELTRNDSRQWTELRKHPTYNQILSDHEKAEKLERILQDNYLLNPEQIQSKITYLEQKNKQLNEVIKLIRKYQSL